MHSHRNMKVRFHTLPFTLIMLLLSMGVVILVAEPQWPARQGNHLWTVPSSYQRPSTPPLPSPFRKPSWIRTASLR